MDEAQIIEKLTSEGFTGVIAVNFEPNQDLGEHKHDELTAHYILEGELTITTGGKVEVFVSGDYVEFPAGTVHSAKFGANGCKFVVGFRK